MTAIDTATTATPLDDSAATDAFLAEVEKLVPVIREHAFESERNGQVESAVIEAAAAMGLFSALVPRSLGGRGLGLRALTESARVLAHGDASSAWALAFLIEHNWMACRLPMAAQKELYADRDFILAAAPLVPGGTAEPVEGGYLISGLWRYGTGFANSDWAFVSCLEQVGDAKQPRAFLVAADDVEVVEEWRASGMGATSSHNIRGEKIFIPTERSMPVENFTSAEDHGGVEHPEAIYHYPMHFGLNNMMAGIFVGIAEAVLDLYEQKLETSKPFGLARRERTPSRIRWGAEREKVRAARLLYLDNLEQTIAKCDERNGYTQEDLGNLQIATLAIAHMCHEAVTSLTKGIGSSAFHLTDPIQRYKRDIDVLINHAGMDWDVVADRSTRWALGFGAEATDWHSAPSHPTQTPPAGR